MKDYTVLAAALIFALLIPGLACFDSGAMLKAKEDVLRENLANLRSALEGFKTDTGQYPATLSILVKDGYFRNLPVDPMTGSSQSWRPIYATVACKNEDDLPATCTVVRNVRSGAKGIGLNNLPYAAW